MPSESRELHDVMVHRACLSRHPALPAIKRTFSEYWKRTALDRDPAAEIAESGVICRIQNVFRFSLSTRSSSLKALGQNLTCCAIFSRVRVLARPLNPAYHGIAMRYQKTAIASGLSRRRYPAKCLPA